MQFKKDVSQKLNNVPSTMPDILNSEIKRHMSFQLNLELIAWIITMRRVFIYLFIEICPALTWFEKWFFFFKIE